MTFDTNINLDFKFATTAELITELKAGRQIILMDDEDRENEGDLIVASDFVSDKHINFMAKYGRGLICLTIENKRAEQLELPLMSKSNSSRYHTNFTVSIEAKEGVTTGISAADRAHTIKTAINPNITASDIVSPGHVFPLIARDGGVLVRTGHTEAATDLTRLAGLTPSGVICEIMNEDGTMARLPDLIPFAKQHNLKIGTIADLVAYRRRFDKIVKLKRTEILKTDYAGDFECRIYHNIIDNSEHVALIKGDLATTNKPIPVRMHSLNSFRDILGIPYNQYRTPEIALKYIHQQGIGVCVIMRDVRPNALSYALDVTLSPATATDFRDYGTGAQILLDLGVREIILLTNNTTSTNFPALDGYDLKVVARQSI
jgi:3,4-dihydroxy 2-butanone 4-phosphate synthase/GTP cyclohydrolase II